MGWCGVVWCGVFLSSVVGYLSGVLLMGKMEGMDASLSMSSSFGFGGLGLGVYGNSEGSGTVGLVRGGDRR